MTERLPGASARWLTRYQGRVLGPVLARTASHAALEFNRIYGIRVPASNVYNERDGLPNNTNAHGRL